jgi:hypothetical protein
MTHALTCCSLLVSQLLDSVQVEGFNSVIVFDLISLRLTLMTCAS